MTVMTKEQIEKLLGGTTPGPWEKMLGTHGRNKICATYPCINGLSALFTIADVNVPEEGERGYTDDAFNPDVAAANTGLIVSAPDLARTALDALARLEDAMDTLSALSSYVGCGLGDEHTTPDDFNKRIRQGIDLLTDPLREMRDKAIAERDDALTRLAAAEAKVGALRAALSERRQTFCLASPGSEEDFHAWLAGFDEAVAIIGARK